MTVTQKKEGRRKTRNEIAIHNPWIFLDTPWRVWLFSYAACERVTFRYDQRIVIWMATWEKNKMSMSIINGVAASAHKWPNSIRSWWVCVICWWESQWTLLRQPFRNDDGKCVTRASLKHRIASDLLVTYIARRMVGESEPTNVTRNVIKPWWE